MTRRILCLKCGGGWKLHEDDRAMGVESRRLSIKLGAVPPGHGITIKTMDAPQVFEPMTTFRCDLCGEDMPKGVAAWAVTTWHADREAEPRNWESDYGTT